MTSKRLVHNAAASVVQVLFSAATLLLTYRLLVKHLPIDQIGLWALIIGSTAVARVAELGLGAGVLRFVAGDVSNGRKDLAARSVGMAVVCVVALVGVVTIIAYPIALPLLLKAAPPGLDGAVRELLACALAAVVLGAVGNVFMGAIDGCQRMDIRVGLQMGGNVVQLVSTYLALSMGGLAKLGYVQIAQSSFLLLGGVALAVGLIGARLREYLQFDGERLRQILAYGGGLQVSAIAQLLFEPLTKVLLTTFGGLALTGYFDVANRLIVQLRAIIIAAYTALVPHVAARVRDGQIAIDEVRSTYLRSCDLLLYVLLPYSACVAAALPLMLTLWLGHFDATLLAIALLQFVGWSLNSLNPPAYYLFVALGLMRKPIMSHVLIGLVTLVTGSIFGYLWGGWGVLAGSVAALMIGSLYLLAAFHREFQVPTAALFGRWRMIQIALTLAAVAFSAWMAARGVELHPAWPMLLAPPLIVGTIALALTVRDPFGRQMFTWLRSALAS